jgi:hypothetical protein
VATVLWFFGLGLAVASFGFLFSRSEQRDTPRITVEPWWPEPPQPRS